MDEFNDVQKRYLSTCLGMFSTPEADKIGSESMRVHDMTEKGEVSFYEGYKRLLDLRDEIGTKGDKEHKKLEAKARLNQKYYRVHK